MVGDLSNICVSLVVSYHVKHEEDNSYDCPVQWPFLTVSHDLH